MMVMVLPSINGERSTRCDILQASNNLFQNRPPQISMCDLSPTENDRDLDFVAVIKELSDGARLEFQVVVIDLRPQAHALELGDLLILLGFPLLLCLLILELAVIKDTADRGNGRRSNFHQIHAGFARLAQCIINSHDAQLLTFWPDEAYISGTDAFVDAKLFTDARSPRCIFPDCN